MTTRRTVAAAVGATALLGLAPTAAHSQEPTKNLVREYQSAYKQAKRAGAEPGRNIVRQDVQVKSRAQDTRPARAGELRRSLAVLERMSAPVGAAIGGSTAAPHLEAIAACESGGDPTAVDASGTYRGKYQFDLQTWASVGGTGDPAAAPEAVQDEMAARLYAQRGSSPWPVCGS